jgi:hypothetical protein
MSHVTVSCEKSLLRFGNVEENQVVQIFDFTQIGFPRFGHVARIANATAKMPLGRVRDEASQRIVALKMTRIAFCLKFSARLLESHHGKRLGGGSSRTNCGRLNFACLAALVLRLVVAETRR